MTPEEQQALLLWDAARIFRALLHQSRFGAIDADYEWDDVRDWIKTYADYRSKEVKS
jgi:hypothetical protein